MAKSIRTVKPREGQKRAPKRLITGNLRYGNERRANSEELSGYMGSGRRTDFNDRRKNLKPGEFVKRTIGGKDIIFKRNPDNKGIEVYSYFSHILPILTLDRKSVKVDPWIDKTKRGRQKDRRKRNNK